MTKIKKITIVVIGTLLICSTLLYYVNSSPSDMHDLLFTVNNGETLRVIANNLKNNNAIKNTNFFVGSAYLLRKKNLKTGRYRVFAGMTTFDILRKLSQGAVLTQQVTIPEGFNLDQIAERLDSLNICYKDKFLHYAKNKEFLKSIGINADRVEGYLFPDTYVFSENSDPREVIIFMYSKTKQVLQEIKQEENISINSNIHNILTMASLVEDEAQKKQERPLIAAVFHNRIRKGIPLSSCATIRYAKKKYTGTVTYADLKVDSPYNTYMLTGLPPTPISSPGKESIIAALKPAKTDYLYFVSRKDGSHYFSRTLREHNRAAEYYLKGINNGFVDNQR